MGLLLMPLERFTALIFLLVSHQPFDKDVPQRGKVVLDYSQVSRHKKGKNSEEQANEAAPNISSQFH